MNIHQKIKAIRMLRGISQKKLAEVVGSENYQAVQQWEGVAKPALANLAAVADCLGTTIDYLVRDDDAPYPSDIQAHKGTESRNPNLITAEWSAKDGVRIISSRSTGPRGWSELTEEERAAFQSLVDAVLSGLVILPNTKSRNQGDNDGPLGRLR